CVDQDAAGSEFARHTGGSFRIRRANVGDEAEFGVIGDFNGLGFRLVRQYRKDRPEDLFLRDAHLAGHVGEHGGLHEISTLKSLGMAFPADDELRTFLDPGLDVFLHALVLLCAANGPRVTSLSRGSPILIFSTTALANRFTSSSRSWGTIRRDAAMQACPLFK